MRLMRIYHGTDIISARNICETKYIDVKCGSQSVDFGPGFYTTEDFGTASIWAYRKGELRKSKPAVVTLYFDIESSKSIIECFEVDLRWGRFIINNRNGYDYISKVEYKENNLDSKYEITYGRISDVEIMDIADDLLAKGEMLNSIDKIFNKKYSNQIVFHTRHAIEYIKKMSYKIV